MRISACCIGVFLALTAPATWATTVLNFTGVFNQDDNVQLFDYTVQNTGFVTVATTSYATGGFAPILSLFDQTGQFLFDDAATNHSPESDVSLQWNSLAGAQYIIALTEVDNFAIAAGDSGNLSEGFTHGGEGNFTANPPINPGLPGGFYDGTGGPQLTGDWAVTFSAPDALGLSATAVPEPGSWTLFGIGALLTLGSRQVRKKLRAR